MKNDSEYEYAAFISYSHRDEKFAKRLQDAIEHYRIPSTARKEIDESKVRQLRSVFRDATDLGVAVLREQLKKELVKSRFLIVVCSPNSARPNLKGEHWVNDEVKHYVDMGRADRIVPVILDGVPGDEARECFCPALADAKIAAVDCQKESWSHCVCKIVAYLLRVRPDALIRRHEEEEREKVGKLWLGAASLLLLLGIGALFAWDSMRTMEHRFADYVDSFGLPEGIFPLFEEECKGRYIHYRFVYRGCQYGASPHADSGAKSWLGFRRKLVRVVQASSSGFPRKWEHPERMNRPLVQDFVYDDKQNRLSEILYGRYRGDFVSPYVEKRAVYYNENGVTNGIVKFFANSEGQLNPFYVGSMESSTILGMSGFSTKCKIDKHLLCRDKWGRVTRKIFLDALNQNARDLDGLWGRDYVNDDKGRQTEEWYLCPKGSKFVRKANRIGVAGRKYTYYKDVLRRVEYVDSQNVLTKGPSGFMALEVDEWDKNGNILCAEYQDSRGQLRQLDDGFAKEVHIYDDYGNPTNSTFFGTNHLPFVCFPGYDEIHRKFDADGLCTEESYWVKGLKFRGLLGFAEVQRRYYWGQVSEVSYYDETGESVCNSRLGCASIEMQYDWDGNCNCMGFYDTNGVAISSPLGCGCAMVTAQYENGRLGEKVYRNVDGLLTLNDYGVCIEAFQYDNFGNVKTMTFYDDHGKPVTNKFGVHGVRMEYGDYGERKRMGGFDADGDSMVNNEGIASVVANYDDFGNVKEVKFFDCSGVLTTNRCGIAIAQFQYDDYGNRVGETYFNQLDTPVETMKRKVVPVVVED